MSTPLARAVHTPSLEEERERERERERPGGVSHGVKMAPSFSLPLFSSHDQVRRTALCCLWRSCKWWVFSRSACNHRMTDCQGDTMALSRVTAAAASSSAVFARGSITHARRAESEDSPVLRSQRDCLCGSSRTLSVQLPRRCHSPQSLSSVPAEEVSRGLAHSQLLLVPFPGEHEPGGRAERARNCCQADAQATSYRISGMHREVS